MRDHVNAVFIEGVQGPWMKVKTFTAESVKYYSCECARDDNDLLYMFLSHFNV